MNKFSKISRGLVAAALVAGAGAAQAAIDISTETTAAKTDINTAGALIIGVVVAIAVIGWLRRVIR
jgi:hypothetical protein